MAFEQTAGSSLVTADGVLGSSGKATIIFSMHIISGGGGGAVVNLRNGTVVGDTIYISETGTTSKGVTFNYGKGLLLPAGCYVDVDSNTTSALISYMQY